jgi:hypothetical protein
MSQVAIRAALETALASVVPTIPTAFQNHPFEPPSAGSPYQSCFVLFARPDNSVMGGKEYTELGYMQVKLHYPEGQGTAKSAQRAELIRTTFARGKSFTNSGITALIDSTPEISSSFPEDKRLVQNIKIPFLSNIILP